MKAFDLEAAKRGEPIQFSLAPRDGTGGWELVLYVGVLTTGTVVVESFDGGSMRVCQPSALRMKPVPRVRWVQPYISCGNIRVTSPCAWQGEAISAAARCGGDVVIVGAPIRIEYPPEGEA